VNVGIGAWRHSRRAAGDGGAVIIEFAFLFPILAMLLFGIIEFGFQFNDYQSVRQGTRDGARAAVVAQFGTNTTCGLTGVSAAPTSTKEIMCLTKDRIGLGNQVRTKVVVPSGSAPPTGLVIVCAQQPMKSFTAFFSPFIDNKQLKSRVQMRIEKNLGADAPEPTSAEETPPPGGSWSWCADS
jgi:Flp pilus assembly protein TadG